MMVDLLDGLDCVIGFLDLGLKLLDFQSLTLNLKTRILIPKMFI